MPTLAPSNSPLASCASSRRSEDGFTPSWRSAQQGFTPSWRSAQQGFTLIEMIVVLVILGVIAVAAAQAIGRRPAGLARQEAQARIGAAVEAARREAQRTGQAQAVDPGALVDGASLTASLPARGGRPGLILVYPDGSSNGGTVSVDGRPMARIDWLTAEVLHAS